MAKIKLKRKSKLSMFELLVQCWILPPDVRRARILLVTIGVGFARNP